MKRFISSLLLTLFLSATVYANPNSISEQQAMEIAKRSHPGRVLGVKRKSDVFQVKTLSDSGKVRTIKIDAYSGAILSIPGAKRRPGK